MQHPTLAASHTELLSIVTRLLIAVMIGMALGTTAHIIGQLL